MNSTANVNWEQLSLVLGDENEHADDEMRDLFRLFVDDAGRRLRTLGAPGGADDRTVVAKESHKIRGAASSFGFDHVASILRRVEMEAASLTHARLDEVLRDALAVFEQSLREVHERYPALGG